MTAPTLATLHAQLAENIVEAENDHDYERLFSVVHDEVVFHRSGASGPGALRPAAEALYRLLPDHHRDIERLLPGEHFVVMQWRLTGTRDGRRYATTGCSILEFADLRLIGAWCFTDDAPLDLDALARQHHQNAPHG